MDRLKSLAVFVEIVSSGSLANAAERLGLSPSMVAKHLNGLEAHLGVRLLQRTTRRQHLTEAGALYLARSREILERLQAADEAAAALCGEPVGQLRISAPVSFGSTQLTQLLAAFLARYPQVDVELRLSDAPLDPVGEGIDLAFRIGPLADSALVARPLPAWYQMRVCAAPAYLARRGTPETPEALLHHDCLGHTRWGPRHPWRFESAEGPLEIPVHYRLRVDSGPALREAALAGAGIILQPRALVHSDLAAGRLLPLLEDYRLRGRDLFLLYPRDSEAPAKRQAFVEFALAYLG
ncbi:MAG: HTH-type transcriptional regulator DmlR [Pseudomonas citronellolis]|nr:MAG: HTH-type transcriptional regulator DmlR [Pseudomonas citronellolis]